MTITAAQLADRINGVGGSDIPVIAGLLEKYGRTREQLLLEKAGLKEPEPAPEEKVWWGNAIEPLIIKRLKTVKGWSIAKSDTIYHPDYKHLRCNVDGVIRKDTAKRGKGILECKNSKFLSKDGPADYQIAQLIFNIGLTGLKWGSLAILVGGCELQVFEYDHDEELFQNFVTLGNQFWSEVEQLKAQAVRMDAPSSLNLETTLQRG